MEKTALSVFAQLGQKLKEDYLGLAQIFHIDPKGFSINITEHGVMFNANTVPYDGYVNIHILNSNYCTIIMSNGFDAVSAEPKEIDWLAFAEDCLHKYNTADHRAILRAIQAQAAERASANDNTYREVSARLTDLENESK